MSRIGQLLLTNTETKLFKELHEITTTRTTPLKLSHELREEIDFYWDLPPKYDNEMRRKLKITLFKKILAENAPNTNPTCNI